MKAKRHGVKVSKAQSEVSHDRYWNGRSAKKSTRRAYHRAVRQAVKLDLSEHKGVRT